MDVFSYLPSARDDPHATHLHMSFLGLPGKFLMQSLPFAHLSEALNGIKPDVVLGVNFDKNYGIDGDHESKGRKMHPGALISRHYGKCPTATGSRFIIEDGSFEKLYDSAFSDPCSAQVVEQTRTLTARIDAIADTEKCANYGLPCPPKCAISTSTKMQRKSTSGFSNQDNLWEYGLSMQPMPNMVSSRQPFRWKSTKPSLELVFAGVSQPSASCKLTLKKLPLRAPMVQVKVTTKETMDGKISTPGRKKKTAQAANKGHLQSVGVLKQLLCGGVAGVISRSVVAPLDLIKTYLITSHGLGGSPKSALSVFKEIVDASGWQGLFRGNLVNCIRVAPNKAIELCVFEAMRTELNKEGHPLKNVAATIAGGAAGMAGTAATYPLELIRTRLSVQPELYTGILQAITKIFQEEGFMTFYSGLSPSLVGIFPYAATNYFVYDGLRTTYRRSTGRQNVPTIPTLAFGAVAAAVSSTVTYPLEVARRQMQLSLTNAVRKSSVDIIRDIYSQEGFLALYRGLGTTWLKLIPAAGISFVCYEAARLALCIDDASVAVRAKEACNTADEESQT